MAAVVAILDRRENCWETTIHFAFSFVVIVSCRSLGMGCNCQWRACFWRGELPVLGVGAKPFESCSSFALIVGHD